MTLTAFSMNISNTAKEREASTTVESFKELAREFQTAILFGIVYFDENKATNNAVLIDSSGAVKASYRKIHPFAFAGEDKVFNGGCEIISVQFSDMKIGLTICYDLRFPEIFSALGNQCDLIVNIANWPARRVTHWDTLLTAREIENQIFMFGVNRTGVDGNGLEYQKSSQVINPNGDLQELLYSQDEMDLFEIAPSFIRQFRQSFSTRQDRKPALYKSIL